MSWFSEVLQDLSQGFCIHPEKHLKLSFWHWIDYPDDHNPQRAIRAVYDCQKCHGITVKYLYDPLECKAFASRYPLSRSAPWVHKSFDIEPDE